MDGEESSRFFFFFLISQCFPVEEFHADFSPLSGKYTEAVIGWTILVCLMEPNKSVRCSHGVPGHGGGGNSANAGVKGEGLKENL